MWIDKATQYQLSDGGNLIEDFNATQSTRNGRFKCHTTTTGSPIVALDHAKSQTPEALGTHVGALGPGPIHTLDVRTTVHGTNEWMRSWAVNLNIWPVQGCEQVVRSVGGRELKDLRSGKTGVRHVHRGIGDSTFAWIAAVIDMDRQTRQGRIFPSGVKQGEHQPGRQ